jgi:prephenate dehydrogenase
MIKKLTIFGVGLIGGSLALALKKANFCQQIVGCSRDEAHLKRAVELGVIDDYELQPEVAVQGADVVFLSVPMRAMESVMSKFKSGLESNAIITDGGSSKASVVEAARNVFGVVPRRFVPAHPIAGREKSGVEAAFDSLYQDHKVILTPLEDTDPAAIDVVTAMWQAAGSEVARLGVEQHDSVLAATSHLPHVVAYALVDTLSRATFVDEIFQFAAGGFRDLSRIASSDPTMWSDICIENRAAILEMIDSYTDSLNRIKDMIENSDHQQLFETFEKSKTTRDSYVG